MQFELPVFGSHGLVDIFEVSDTGTTSPAPHRNGYSPVRGLKQEEVTGHMNRIKFRRLCRREPPLQPSPPSPQSPLTDSGLGGSSNQQREHHNSSSQVRENCSVFLFLPNISIQEKNGMKKVSRGWPSNPPLGSQVTNQCDSRGRKTSHTPFPWIKEP